MEFLVRIRVCWPPDGDPDRRADLVAAEAARAAELADQNILLRLWRVPGTWSNVGIWAAADASQLHAALASLPFFPWLDIDVQVLAAHPSDPATRFDRQE